MQKEFKRGIPSSFCPFRTFRTSEKHFMFHVLLHDQKYQKSSKTFPLRNLPVVPALLKREQYIPSRANISSEPSDCGQRQEYRLKCTDCLLAFALCHADIRQGFPPCQSAPGALSSVSVQTSCTPATPLYAGVEPAHTRICSATSCDVFARVV